MSKPDLLSRRALLKNACIGGAAVTALTVATSGSAQAAGTIPQTAAKYQVTPKGDHQCSNCNFFAAPAACKLVAGSIAPTGWCSFYSPKKAS